MPNTNNATTVNDYGMQEKQGVVNQTQDTIALLMGNTNNDVSAASLGELND